MSKELNKNISFSRYQEEIKVEGINVRPVALLSEHSAIDEAILVLYRT